jgi:hypothetical protein
MTRKAFLIGSPMIKGQKDYLQGVTPDIVNMANHLSSNRGGAWEDDEIVLFENPTRDELRSSMLGQYDFVIIQYSGHGFEYTISGTTLDINPYETVSLSEINSWITCPKRYYFLDCCRGIIVEELKKSSRLFSARESGVLGNREAYRHRYDSIIATCENGVSIIYSCGLNESADEDDDDDDIKGGIFSLSYFRSARSIKNVSLNEYYSIQSIFNMAVERMKKDYPLAYQNPTMKPERRNRYFPFVI